VDEEKVRGEIERGARGSEDGGNKVGDKREGGSGENIINSGGNNNSTTEEGDTTTNNTNTMARYAIKYLSPTRTAPHPSDPKNKVFQRGIADLAMEACFLSLMSHENIITCHYVSEGSLEENFNTDEDIDGYEIGGGGRGIGGTGGMGRRGEKKRRFREEIVTDAMGNLVLREVPIDDDDDVDEGDKNDGDKKGGDEEEQQEKQDEKKSSYTHRFGYFLLLDVLHETLAHRIDHVYIPQVLLANNGSNINSVLPTTAAAGGGTLSSNGSVNSSGASSSLLLHTQEKRESFLKRMTKSRRSPSSFLRRASHGSSSSGGAPGVQSLQHSDHSHPHSSSNNNVASSPYDYINNQKLKLASRLTSLLAIANALQYLHEHQILFRDIKPDNIGFYRDYSHICTCGKRPEATVKGTDVSMRDCTCYNEIPKLFDFGLAKELKSKYRVDPARYAARIGSSPESYAENKKYAHHSSHRGHGSGPGSGLRRAMLGGGSSKPTVDDAVYKLTGCTGSRRYMAPEVCFNDPYNEKADVYSFGMMLYQVASLVTPFDGYSSYDHEKEVLRGGFRPDIELPTKKDILVCKQMEEMLFTAGNSGGSGGGDDDEIELNSDDEEDYYRKKNNNKKKEGELPPPSENRNKVLAIKSKSVWTKDLKRLIDECWDYDMRYRPTMKDVVVRLQGCIDDLLSSSSQQQKKGKDSSELNDVRRGSRNNVMIHRQKREEEEEKVKEGVLLNGLSFELQQ
jgi:serine/threonine protein kinase